MYKYLLTAMAVLSLLIAALLGALLARPSAIVSLAQWYINTYSDYRIELKNAELVPLEISFSAAEIHLYQSNADGPALLSLLDLQVHTQWRDLIEQDLSNTKIKALAFTVYQSDSDEAVDPTPSQWAGQLRWLPQELNVGSIHWVSMQQQTWIFPLQHLEGRRLKPGQYRTTATAHYDNKPLNTTFDIFAVRESAGQVDIDLWAQLVSPASNSTITVDGRAIARTDSLDYSFDIEANYADIGNFLAAIETPWQVDGALSLSGKLDGDWYGYKLSDAQFQLDNKPHYSFAAAGGLSYHEQTPGSLNIKAQGQMQNMSDILQWLGVDLEGLGSADANLSITGTLQDPVLSDFLLSTYNSDQLSSQFKGYLELGRETQTNYVDFSLQGPSLDSLSRWIGSVPIDPGPWQAQGRIVKKQSVLSATDLQLQLGDPNTLQLKAEGHVKQLGTLDGTSLQTLAVEGANIALQVEVADGNMLQPLLEQTLPSDLVISARGKLSGGDNNVFSLQAEQVDASAGRTIFKAGKVSTTLNYGSTLTLGQLTGSFQFTVPELHDLQAYVEERIPTGISLHMTADVSWNDALNLPSVDARMDSSYGALALTGRADSVLKSPVIDLDGNFDSSDLSIWLPQLLPSYHIGSPVGQLLGSFKLSGRDSNWKLSQVTAKSSSHAQLGLTLNGEAQLSGSQYTASGDISFNSDNSELVTQITQLPVASLSSQARISLDNSELLIQASGDFGSTLFTGDVNIAHEDGDIQAVDATLKSPLVYLKDFQLAQAKEADSGQAAAQDEQAWIDSVLANSPKFATDIEVSVDGLTGDNTNIQGLNLHVVGQDNRYTLRRFNVDYNNTQGVLRGLIDLNPSPPAISLAGEAIDIPISSLFQDLGIEFDIEGDLTFRGGIAGRGQTGEELLSALNGNVAVAAERLTIEGAAYDVLATDLLSWLLTGAALTDSTQVDCAMVRFDIRDGLATTDNLSFESGRMLAKGKGDINLADNSLDISISPRSKNRALQVPNKIRVHGSLDDPKTSISAVRATVDLPVEIVAIVPEMLRKLFGRDRNPVDDFAPCEANLSP